MVSRGREVANLISIDVATCPIFRKVILVDDHHWRLCLEQSHQKGISNVEVATRSKGNVDKTISCLQHIFVWICAVLS